MKKQFYTLLATTLLLVPIYGYAHTTEPHTPHILLASSTSAIASSTEEASFSVAPERTFTVCSQEAIEMRDTNIATSRSIYNTAMTNALTERKNREKAAVALKKEDAKKDALKVSVETYKAQAKSAQTSLTQARKVSWQTFDNDVKDCRELEKIEHLDTLASSTEEQVMPTARTMMMKKGGEDDVKETRMSESKSFKDTLKDKIESFKSLFN